MLTRSEDQVLKTYGNKLIACMAWDHYSIEESNDTELDTPLTRISIIRPLASYNEFPLVILKSEGAFELHDGEGILIAEGSTIEDVLKPWAPALFPVEFALAA